MKKIKQIILWVIFLLMFIFSAFANAELWVDGTRGLVYDTHLGITYLQDANYAMTSGYDSDGLMTWDQAMTWVDNLIIGGYDDWRLPSAYNQDGSGPCSSVGCNNNELGHLYFTELGNIGGVPLINSSPFINLQSATYWFGTEDASNPTRAWSYQFNGSDQDQEPKIFTFNAIAVRDGNSGVAPEPISSILFLTGGATLIGRRYLRRKV